jgi:hypothetical protein
MERPLNFHKQHTNLKKVVQKAICKHFDVVQASTFVGLCVAWDRRATAKIPTMSGQAGQPDLYFVLAPLGVYVGIEIKTGNAKQSKEQKQWQKTIEAVGGFYFVATSKEQSIEAMHSVMCEVQKRTINFVALLNTQDIYSITKQKRKEHGQEIVTVPERRKRKKVLQVGGNHAVIS